MKTVGRWRTMKTIQKLRDDGESREDIAAVFGYFTNSVSEMVNGTFVAEPIV